MKELKKVEKEKRKQTERKPNIQVAIILEI